MKTRKRTTSLDKPEQERKNGPSRTGINKIHERKRAFQMQVRTKKI
jgi:hypothetical protein